MNCRINIAFCEKLFLGWATEQCVPWVQGNVERDFNGKYSCEATKQAHGWASEAWITYGGWAQVRIFSFYLNFHSISLRHMASTLVVAKNGHLRVSRKRKFWIRHPGFDSR